MERNLVPPFVVRAREGAMEVRHSCSKLDEARMMAVLELEDDGTWGDGVVVTITSREYVRRPGELGVVRDDAPVSIYRR